LDLNSSTQIVFPYLPSHILGEKNCQKKRVINSRKNAFSVDKT
jgi:hypothetical protein